MKNNIIQTMVAAILFLQGCASTGEVLPSLVGQPQTDHRHIITVARLDNVNAIRTTSLIDSSRAGANILYSKAFVSTYVAEEDIFIRNEEGEPHLKFPKGRKLAAFVAKEEMLSFGSKLNGGEPVSYYCGAMDRDHVRVDEDSSPRRTVSGCFRDSDFDGIIDQYFKSGHTARIINTDNEKILTLDKSSDQYKEELKEILVTQNPDLVIVPAYGPFETKAQFVPFTLRMVEDEDRMYFQQWISVRRIKDNLSLMLLSNPSPVLNVQTKIPYAQRKIFSKFEKDIFSQGNDTFSFTFLGNEITVENKGDNWGVSSQVKEDGVPEELYMRTPKFNGKSFHLHYKNN
ncbi:hypothetical protein [Hirschia litorea]|uniref:Lipoprotein n=1 Tax=Hirschia litorea TaxID=1199156 RepID=A0ABW2IL43_9PROT